MAQLKEVQEKDRRIREFMAAKGLAGVLMTRRDSFAWATCGSYNHVAMATDFGLSSALITSKDKFIVTSNIEAPRLADEEAVGQGFAVKSHPWHEGAEREKLVAGLAGGGRVGSDDGTPGTEPLPAGFTELRFSLTDAEVARYRKLGQECGQAIAEVTRSVVPGETEAGIAARMAKASLDRGILPNVVLIAVDDRIEKYRHPIFTNRKVKTCAMIVLCGQRHGLIVSVTRLVHFGPLPKVLRRKHDAAALIDATAIAATKVGAGIGDIFKTVTEAYAQTGFADEWKLHHQGGPTGYAARDFVATPSETRAVQLNQAYAWNPSITGTKTEDTIVALKSGPLVISLTDWPVVTQKAGGMVLQRPDILVK